MPRGAANGAAVGTAAWILVLLLIGGALATLTVAIRLPLVTSEIVFEDPSTYSVLSGIAQLHSQGDVALAALILAFSVLFPYAKLLGLLAVWFRVPKPETRHALVRTMRILGKWSMLDFFVVIVIAASLELGVLATANVEYGAYVFAGAIFLSMATTYIVDAVITMRQSGGRSRLRGRLPLVYLPLVALNAFLLARGIGLPMLGLEKWLFWENSFSLLEAIDRLAGEESVWLARTVFVLVILLPFASLAGWMIVGVASHVRQPLGRWAAVVLELEPKAQPATRTSC